MILIDETATLAGASAVLLLVGAAAIALIRSISKDMKCLADEVVNLSDTKRKSESDAAV